MAKGDWPKSYVIPSIALTATAAGFLIWHVLAPAAKVDGWTITLLVVAFLPWLRTVFESIDFPGGASVKWREKVEAKQERQDEEIQAMRFLLARFITPPERELLQRLAGDDEVPFNSDDNGATVNRANALHRAGMIAGKVGIIESAQRGETVPLSTLNQIYDITHSGRQYLDLIANLPDDVVDTFTDSTRPTT